MVTGLYGSNLYMAHAFHWLLYCNVYSIHMCEPIAHMDT